MHVELGDVVVLDGLGGLGVTGRAASAGQALDRGGRLAITVAKLPPLTEAIGPATNSARSVMCEPTSPSAPEPIGPR
ncbi:Protein of unknown function [Propionibacterium freudenreichii]|nr:Protein of unknown function [Propionibacterium freudenreichii]CEI26801.1 Protein of unknown function [Propionibacterium freudenreichii]CEI30225.1 Protein of unknown function [Propionibacterium freudenreichii]